MIKAPVPNPARKIMVMAIQATYGLFKRQSVTILCLITLGPLSVTGAILFKRKYSNVK